MYFTNDCEMKNVGYYNINHKIKQIRFITFFDVFIRGFYDSYKCVVKV